LAAVERKTDINEVDDKTLILADIARKAQHQVFEFVHRLLSRRMANDEAEKLARLLSEGTWTHDFPIDVEYARSLGLNVSTDLPDEVRLLMRLYPQPKGRRPSVEYIDVPYGERGRGDVEPRPTRRRPARESGKSWRG
jgi:ClpP class serine protease